MILIVGGGLAGLSTAYHLGSTPHLVLEGEPDAGGLCRSREIDGFVFDYTGHLLHLRDERIERLVDRLLPDTFETVARKAAIRTDGKTLPFPFQANLHGLAPEKVAACLTGFVEALDQDVPGDPGVSFREWSLAVFGRGISDAFMLPYNAKLFRRDPDEMTADWVSWAVPRPSLEQVVRGALGLENRGLGYNPTFRYPRKGGIGCIPAALASRVPHVRYGARVTGIDLAARTVALATGETLGWERLVVTTPLPELLGMLSGGAEPWREHAAGLDWSVVRCLNLGVAREKIADGAHWLYFPDEDAPFYRVGFPTNFSNGVAPAGCSSLYIEFGCKRGEPFDAIAMAAQAKRALYREGILDPDDRILVEDWATIDPGYVIFDRSRQRVMERVVPALAAHDVHPIGRYGAWTYSYMERALLDGLELAGKIGACETVS